MNEDFEEKVFKNEYELLSRSSRYQVADPNIWWTLILCTILSPYISPDIRNSLVTCKISTYNNFFPLAHISDQSWESEEPEQAEELGQPQHPEGPGGVQELLVGPQVLQSGGLVTDHGGGHTLYLLCVQDPRVQDQEDVVHGDGAQEVQEEPGLDIFDSNQLGLHDDFVTVITFFEPCNTSHGVISVTKTLAVAIVSLVHLVY